MIEFYNDIIVCKHWIDPDECDFMIESFDNLEHLSIPRTYGEESNVICNNLSIAELNRNSTICPQDASLIQALDNKICALVGRFISTVMAPLYKIPVVDSSHNVQMYTSLFDNQVFDSGYHLRKITGPTRVHIDNVLPGYNSEKQYISYRIASLIFNLSDSDNTIVFPYQNKKVPLEKGTVVMFPPYWTHPHYTTYHQTPRYSIQTWLEERYYGKKQP